VRDDLIVAASDGIVLGIDHAQLAMPAGGEEAARAFYGGVLGLNEVPKPKPLASHGGCWFIGAEAGSPFSIHLGVEADFRPARKAHPALLVADLDRLRARLAAAGAITVDDERPIGVRRFYAFDPFGNRLELVDQRDAGFSARSRA
jgi:catechol 2,3-dioxygenase-like lactoylglutathione lyase family enzyme